MYWETALSIISWQRTAEHAYRMARMMRDHGKPTAAIFWQEEAARVSARARKLLFQNIPKTSTEIHDHE
jgi:hypothetical protein